MILFCLFCGLRTLLLCHEFHYSGGARQVARHRKKSAGAVQEFIKKRFKILGRPIHFRIERDSEQTGRGVVTAITHNLEDVTNL
jgi:hypothetical protein